jgi:hypothetical protein
VRAITRHRGQRRLAIGYGIQRLEATSRQQFSDGAAEGLAVVNDQDPAGQSRKGKLISDSTPTARTTRQPSRRSAA